MSTSPSSSLTCTVTPPGTLPGGYNAHLENKMDSLRGKIILSFY
jgi:hypothetical protein